FASPSPEALAPNRKGVRGCRRLSDAVGCPAGASFFARMIIFDMKKFFAAHDKLKCGGNRQFQPISAHIPLRSENKKGVELVAPHRCGKYLLSNAGRSRRRQRSPRCHRNAFPEAWLHLPSDCARR